MKRHQKSIKNLIDTHLKRNPSVGAEVGVWCGDTSRMLLKTFPKLFLYMVDFYKEEGMCRLYDKMKPTPEDALKKAFVDTAPWSDRRFMMIEHSKKAAQYIADESLEFVFIDACHYYETAKVDIEAWAPKVIPGGIVMGHDYSRSLEVKYGWGVKKAVDEYAKKNSIKIEEHQGTVWSFVK